MPPRNVSAKQSHGAWTPGSRRSSAAPTRPTCGGSPVTPRRSISRPSTICRSIRRAASLDAILSPLAEGSALFYEFLDATEGVGGPGRLPTALIATAAQKTDPRAWQWDNEPDVFDVLRHTLGDSARRMADLIGRLAVDRAFLGDRDDGTHLPSMMWAGSFGRVRFAWSIPYSSLPRRVAPAHPLMPTGSAYLWLSLDKVTAKSSLGFRADWEAPVSFKWTLVRVGKDGSELSRIDVKYEESATHAEKEIVNLSGAAGVLIIGTNMGGADLSHPFDPDVAPYEPHAFTVYLAAM